MSVVNVPKQRKALITGASSGIGEATAKAFANNGYHVILVARSGDLLEQLCNDINQQGGNSEFIPVDLADGDATSELASTVIRRHGYIDVLVNNAGYGPPFPLEQMDRQKLRHAFDVNVLSGMQLIGGLTPMWREHGSGRVINVSSLTRYVSAPVAATYAGTKGAMETMTNCLRLELKPWNIEFSLVIPGFVDTPTFDKSKAAGKEMRDAPDNPYQTWMKNLEEFSDSQSGSAIPPQAVAKVILAAANASKPKHRYFVPFSSSLAAMLFGLLPSRIADKLLLKMYRWGS